MSVPCRPYSAVRCTGTGILGATQWLAVPCEASSSCRGSAVQASGCNLLHTAVDSHFQMQSMAGPWTISDIKVQHNRRIYVRRDK